MGVDHRAWEVLERLDRSGRLNGKRVLTLGRQHIDDRENGPNIRNEIEWLDEFVNTSKLESLDVSSYEGATHVADLQGEIPEDLIGQFDIILDFGTVEHIFDIAKVYDNIYELLAPNGLYVGLNGRTGWNSHGLFQFTPEFAFVVANTYGFELECFTVSYGEKSPTWFKYETYGHDPASTWAVMRDMTYLVMFLSKDENSHARGAAQSIRYDGFLHVDGEEPGTAVVVQYDSGEFYKLPI